MPRSANKRGCHVTIQLSSGLIRIPRKPRLPLRLWGEYGAGARALIEPVGVAGLLSGAGGPLLPRRVERLAGREFVRLELAALLQPCADGVLAVEIGGGGVRARPSVAPARSAAIAAALDHPPQNCRAIRPRAFDEIRIALVFRDGHGERDEVQAPANRLVDPAKAGLVVAGDEQLELRGIGEDPSA